MNNAKIKTILINLSNLDLSKKWGAYTSTSIDLVKAVVWCSADTFQVNQKLYFTSAPFCRMAGL
jgi:hypothetical protein